MRICGLKLTHDGAIAVVEDGKLVFCIEQEKRENNPRYQKIENLDAVAAALSEGGLRVEDIDQFVVDGWDGEVESQFRMVSGSTLVSLNGAPYIERKVDHLLASVDGTGLLLGGASRSYKSYPHVSGHVASAYCTSPFARSEQPAFCLVWDGGMVPRLYHVQRHGARLVDCLFPLIGQIYAAAGHHFGPYKKADGAEWDLGVAGKLMAYIALGSLDEDIVAEFHRLYQERFAGDTEIARNYRQNVHIPETSLAAVRDFFEASLPQLKTKPHEDVLVSFHVFLERLLVHEMGMALQRHSIPGPRNLCISGGCALNIKWNSALRASGLFDAIWVPPFPNDSGSAIGAACCAMAADKGFVPLEWSVYSGPAVKTGDVPAGWTASPCSIAELARMLADNEPVVFLAGRAELGPRALGARSILAAATSPAMKAILNDIKYREHFRPVAPICLEDRAPAVFCPGTPDPYMLFDHQTRAEWRDKVPAVVHLDGSARLQTIARTSEHPVAQLLIEYEKLTGLPLLCNTSANHHGRGFFPDAASACKWGRVERVWCDGLLLSNARGNGLPSSTDEPACCVPV
ncbi:nodulation protein NodU [Paraburkholderia sabiae]|uniref:Nodulation protein NodU n=1 Tax=Paraburkholderia sabiae TaxID=273251 RepID=A0ABU9QQ40_9BURK|nr:nodulation protein NodU [Paraburkholderia sabiae]WJZ79400.1 nodulation protein NodU [Paraburkholderia sabiae]CAD6562717.1 Decarbamoylnovobiocin carbamoyltransferase [Paraburkholderia sabiae]